MNPYEALANAIIEQAATDHKNAAKFLKRHKDTTALEKIVERQNAERDKRRDERKGLGLKPERVTATKEERLLNQIRSHQSMIADTEKFFLSDWFADLTEVNGEWLLERIKRMEDEA